MKKTREDAHELATLCSLRTASSETLRLDAASKDGPAKGSTHDKSKRLSLRDRQRLAASRLSSWEAGRQVDTPCEVLLELARTDEYGPEMRKMAMRLLQREMEFGQSKEAIARALVALPAEDIQEFFNRWTHKDTRWFICTRPPINPHRHELDSDPTFRITLRTTSQPPTAFWCTLVTTMAEAHATLDRPRALALLAPFNLPPLALLFPAAPDTSHAELALAYVRTTYDDRLPQARAADANPPEADRALEVFAAYLAALRDPAPLGPLLDAVAAGLDARAPAHDRGADCKVLRAAAPGLAGVDAPRGAAPLLHAHPAAPALLCALRLAAWSADARRGLVARGVVRAVERLYDAEEAAAVSAISAHIMLALCCALLLALGECYDAARSTLVEELRAEVVRSSRAMARRFFAPEVWEMRDD
ncbi:hypothetical protein PsYK624_166510 [Phanerochaete sordida]|uniref:Uncharacterized protein n=1 Tax=Phanerochaete sordida TaxID=48140 RepID=A0A9P3GTF7_9APHY|nr:hypothetical protein PsYK624_166510 [Phanerochaete sordida]